MNDEVVSHYTPANATDGSSIQIESLRWGDHNCDWVAAQSFLPVWQSLGPGKSVAVKRWVTSFKLSNREIHLFYLSKLPSNIAAPYSHNPAVRYPRYGAICVMKNWWWKVMEKLDPRLSKIFEAVRWWRVAANFALMTHENIPFSQTWIIHSICVLIRVWLHNTYESPIFKYPAPVDS